MKKKIVGVSMIFIMLLPFCMRAQIVSPQNEIVLKGKYALHLKPIVIGEHIEWQLEHNFPNVTKLQLSLASNADTILCELAHPIKSVKLPNVSINASSMRSQLLSLQISYVEYGQTFTLAYNQQLQSFTMYKDGVYYQYANNYALLNNEVMIERQYIAVSDKE